MREGHILQEDDADTPTKRTYFLVQAMLLSPPPTSRQRELFIEVMDELRACYQRPAAIELLDETQGQVEDANYYKALSALRRLIDYEAQLLKLEPPQWRRQSQPRPAPVRPALAAMHPAPIVEYRTALAR